MRGSLRKGRVSVCPSVCLFCHVDRQYSGVRRRSAANAGSVMLRTDERGSIQTRFRTGELKVAISDYGTLLSQ